MIEQQEQPPTVAKTYPRIWDRSGERTIIGETKQSWIVVRRGSEQALWVDHIDSLRADKKCAVDWYTFAYIKSNGWIELVSKKSPNDNPYWPQWWFDENSRNDHIWRYYNREKIGRIVSHGNLSAGTLRKIAELIGYQEGQP